jgi:hypothetical protein
MSGTRLMQTAIFNRHPHVKDFTQKITATAIGHLPSAIGWNAPNAEGRWPIADGRNPSLRSGPACPAAKTYLTRVSEASAHP